jgi:hypothetical protein
MMTGCVTYFKAAYSTEVCACRTLSPLAFPFNKATHPYTIPTTPCSSFLRRHLACSAAERCANDVVTSFTVKMAFEPSSTGRVLAGGGGEWAAGSYSP